jgi:hypothetical protein
VSPIWVNGRFLVESENRKIKKWKPEPSKEKALWGICRCGEPIYEGNAVGMVAEHELVVCYTCWLVSDVEEMHLDCAGLKLPDATLSQ